MEYLIYWTLAGFLAYLLSMFFRIRKGLDITVEDIFMGLVSILIGPVFLFIALYVLYDGMKDRIIVKGKK